MYHRIGQIPDRLTSTLVDSHDVAAFSDGGRRLAYLLVSAIGALGAGAEGGRHESCAIPIMSHERLDRLGITALESRPQRVARIGRLPGCRREAGAGSVTKPNT